jgi:predicted NBD/HSP70 family sugar kinase
MKVMHEVSRGAAGASEIFQLLRDGTVWTRAELAEVTGLARSTIALRLEQLISLGLIMPGGDSSLSTGGRPPVQFRLNPNANVVLAVDVGASHVAVGVSNLSGEILIESKKAMNVADGPDPVLGWVVDEARRQMQDLGRPIEDILAVGIGLPSPVEHSTGRPINPPLMPSWDGLDVPEWLGNHIDAPILVDNDVNIMALGERASAFPDVDDLVFVKVSTGIGSGIISNGTLQRGSRGTAGDIGHIQVSRAHGIACRCGNLGCLEAIAAWPAIAAELRSRGHDATKVQDILDLVRSGNVDAIQVVRQAGRDIGEVLATCVSMLNPSVIVVGGILAQSAESLLAGVREVVYGRSLPLATGDLQIVAARTGDHAGVLGAATMVIQHVLSSEQVEVQLAGLAG